MYLVVPVNALCTGSSLKNLWQPTEGNRPKIFALEISLSGALHVFGRDLEMLSLQPKALCHVGLLNKETMKKNVRSMSQSFNIQTVMVFKKTKEAGKFLFRA